MTDALMLSDPFDCPLCDETVDPGEWDDHVAADHPEAARFVRSVKPADVRQVDGREALGGGIRGVCPACRRQDIVMVVDTAGGVRIRHGSAVKVCRSRDNAGPTYYVHPARDDGGDDE